MENVMDLFRLNQKVIVATGASGYLCSHFVEAIGQAGGNIAMVDIPANEEKLKELQARLQKEYGITVKYYLADNSKEEDIKRVSEQVFNDFKRIDGLINAAGVNQHGSIKDYTGKDYERLMNINVVGTFLCCKYFGKYMVNQKQGSIVNIASFTGTIVNKPPFNMSGYCTSKAGLLHLTRSVTSEYGEYNVRVNSVSPGFLEKGMSNVKNFIKLNDPRVFENSMNNTPMHRVGKPSELIGAVIYLLSDASTYTTGIDIVIDGGYHVW